MHLARTPLTAVLVLAGAASGMSACSGYDSPLPPRPEVLVAASPPPAISGGTLIVNEAGDRAFASDPDRDRVLVVDITAKKMLAEIALEDGDEPGRLVLADNRLFVSLRGAGAVAMIDVAEAKVVGRVNVCAAPRGMAFQSDLEQVHVACAGGDLVTLDSLDGTELRRLHLDDDLRDIVVDGSTLLISRFRKAEILRIDAEGLVAEKRVTFQSLVAPGFDEFTGESKDQVFEPEVAWRMVAGRPNGGAVVLHQRAMTTPVKIQTNGYAAGGCDNSIVHGTVGSVPSEAELDDPYGPVVPALGSTIGGALLPVDVAYSPSLDAVAVAAAGNDRVFIANLNGSFETGFDDCSFGMTPVQMPDGPIAVAWSAARADFVVQTRDPAKLVLSTGEVIADLGGESVFDTGHQMFHTNPNGVSSLACASCHPEGRDDGRTWNFDPIGPRRTPTLGGGIVTTTAPLHWDGDMTEGLDTIMKEVFVNRMGGQQNGPRRVDVFASWLDALPAFRPITPRDPDAAARGEALFRDPTVACATCHSGPLFTNNETVDVGTGMAFQVPPLVGLGSRAPYMHDGCAKTLRDRFSASVGAADRTSCGGDRHGVVSHLSSEQLDDLVAFLETL